MYVTASTNGHVEVKYISAHTAHELGTSELPHLPLPKGVKEEVALKISTGIPSERIMEGIYSTADMYAHVHVYNYTSSILVVDIDTDNILNHCCRRYRQPYQKRGIRTVCSSKHFITKQDITNASRRVKDCSVIRHQSDPLSVAQVVASLREVPYDPVL